MTHLSQLPSSFAATVDWLYAGLMRAVPDPEHGLEGHLVYVGELHPAGCALAAAANVACAGTLAVGTDATGKQALRDGVIDFLVTSMDEALRILKNGIRKRQSVAVCVKMAPDDVEREMLERGVLPDLLPPGTIDAPRYASFLAQGARQVNPVTVGDGETVLRWTVGRASALWLPKLDALIGQCLGPDDWAAQRWLRSAPRYLGRAGQGMRLLRCRTNVAREFLRRVEDQVTRGEIETQVEFSMAWGGQSEECRFAPAARRQPAEAGQPS